MGGELNDKQRLFVSEYLRDHNATKAAQAAGYSKKTAGVQGHELLKNPKIRKILKKKMAEREKRTEVSIDDVIVQLKDILTTDPLDMLDEAGAVRPMAEWPEALRYATSSMEVKELEECDRDGEILARGRIVKVKLWSKIGAAELLLRKLGAFKDEALSKNIATLSEILAAASRGETE